MPAAIMAAILIAGEVASALDFNSEAPAHVVTNTVPSAHVPWAKPLAGGPIRVLMIAPRFTLRDAVELEQRADVRLEVVGLWDSTHLGCDPLRPVEGVTEEEVRQRLQQQLQKRWDVLILANLDVAVLPEAEQYALLEHVNQGAGLLLAHHRASQSCPLVTFLNSLPPQAEAGDLARGIGETGGRGWLSGKVPVSTSEAGAGRVVQLTYPGDPPRTHALIAVPADPLNAPPALLDNSFAFVIRCLLWAARRDPEVFISDIIDIAPKGPTEEEIPPGLTTEFVQSVRDSVTNQPLRPFRLQLNAEADRDYEVLYQLRSGERTVPVPSPEAILPNGAGQYAIDILSRPGTFFLDVWLRSRKGTHDWFTKRIEVPGWPGLLNVRASKTFLLPNDAMDITAEIRPVFSVVDINSASKPRTGVLYARAEDNTGQVVAENHMPVTTEGGRLHLPLQFADLTAPLVKVNVYV
ncbi:MAG: hypothetical protein HYZ00_14135, partial [Candidatus Hydrogenedentes bacterium]|nr:hypothetical protein [Candidatus Hydrogenedentota bacterium]